MLKVSVFAIILVNAISLYGQYPPPAGQAGSTAIHSDSSLIHSWATNCSLFRSYLDISDTILGLVSYGTETDALGSADNNVVSLGDGGSAILSFSSPIYDGPGPDFAVFENAFTEDYLEFAHVEVSSDGINYYRFPSVSLIDTIIQTSSFGVSDASKVHNLAGKYKVYYGTPFDLQELEAAPLLNKNSITHIKIIDVVGSLDSNYCSRDFQGHIINDPWPTAFESGGFDLDAVGLINVNSNAVEKLNINNPVLYPNPVIDRLNIQNLYDHSIIYLYDLYGKMIMEREVYSHAVNIDISNLKAGLYNLIIVFENDVCSKKIIKSKD